MEKVEKKNYNKKSGVKPVLLTVFFVLVLVVSSVLIMAFVFPKTMGDFVYSIGLNDYACKLYERDYNENGDINSLYSSLNLAIKTNNNEKVIVLFEEFEGHEDYAEFINFINKENLKLDEQPLIKASLLNEDNYLKNKYVSALISKGYVEKAFNYAVNDGINLTPKYNNLGNFLFANFVNSGSVLSKEKFNVVLDGKSSTLLSDFYVCFNALAEEFESEYNNVEDFYIASVGNRAQVVGSTINAICVALGQEQDENIVATLNEINENLSTKLMN